MTDADVILPEVMLTEFICSRVLGMRSVLERAHENLQGCISAGSGPMLEQIWYSTSWISPG
jgi:hypothetical protein